MSLTPPAPETETIRSAIARKADEARTQGAHYLTGCYGAVPLSCDPVVGRMLYLVDNPAVANLGVHAAEIREPKLYRCAGRFAQVHGRRLDDSAGRRLLRTYESDNCGASPSFLPDIEGLYPRCAQHPLTQEKWNVLGEDCRYKMHFDCVGLVNWAVSRVVGVPLQYGVRMWADSSVAPVEVEDFPFTELRAGDILVRPQATPEHIAIVGFGGNLIEAKGFDQGVIQSSVTAGYTRHARLTDEWLLRRAVH